MLSFLSTQKAMPPRTRRWRTNTQSRIALASVHASCFECGCHFSVLAANSVIWFNLLDSMWIFGAARPMLKTHAASHCQRGWCPHCEGELQPSSIMVWQVSSLVIFIQHTFSIPHTFIKFHDVSTSCQLKLGACRQHPHTQFVKKVAHFLIAHLTAQNPQLAHFSRRQCTAFVWIEPVTVDEIGKVGSSLVEHLPFENFERWHSFLLHTWLLKRLRAFSSHT